MKPIETIFDGYRFRSRLEARWAVFFKTAGIAYEYEPEGYDLEGLWYLPDFWVKDWRSWLEIKPTFPSHKEQEKAHHLWQQTGKRCILAWGSPYAYVAPDLFDTTVEYQISPAYAPGSLRRKRQDGDWIDLFAECPSCEGLHLASFLKMTEVSTGGLSLGCRCTPPGPLSIDYEYARTPRLIEAYTAARQARFEHGEKGHL